MSTTPFRHRRTLLGAMPLGLAAAAAPSAFAQTMLKIPAGNLKIELPKVAGAAAISTKGARGSVITAASAPIASASALTHFNLGFMNGDHKFRRLQLLVEGNGARVALTDQNDDDPFQAEARWVNFTGGVAGTVQGEGHGRAVTTLKLPPAPPRHVLALRGFELARAGGTDANIRHLAIRPVDGALEVTLNDDEGMDLRGTGGAAIVFDPVHFVIVSQASRNLQRGRPYSVTVQYVWIPEILVAGTEMITGGERTMRDAARIPAGRQAVIRGFQFSFLNSDHHLLQVSASTENGGMGIFRDNVEDDPMRWRIDYALLRT